MNTTTPNESAAIRRRLEEAERAKAALDSAATIDSLRAELAEAEKRDEKKRTALAAEKSRLEKHIAELKIQARGDLIDREVEALLAAIEARVDRQRHQAALLDAQSQLRSVRIALDEDVPGLSVAMLTDRGDSPIPVAQRLLDASKAWGTHDPRFAIAQELARGLNGSVGR